MKNSTVRIALLLALAAMSVLALAACGDDDDDSNGADTDTPAATTPADSGSGGESPDADDDKDDDDDGESSDETEFEVVMTDNVFTPSQLTVPAGETITFKAKNEGTAIHNMHILSQATEGKDYMSDAIVTPGDDSEFEVVFNTPGTVDFQCDYHLPDMVGTIEVVD